MKTMNPETPDKLDHLLASSPMPKAPAWFEARTLARLRVEQEKLTLWSRMLAFIQDQGRAIAAARIVTACVCALMAFFFWQSVLKPGARQQMADKKLFDAFSAFNSYVVEQEGWNNTGF